MRTIQGRTKKITGTDRCVDLAVTDSDRPETPTPLPIAVDSPNGGESVYGESRRKPRASARE